MKTKLKHILFLLFTVIFTAGATANDYRFTSLSLDDGLSHPSVRSILRDNKGYLWIGTRSGLNRYDKGKMRVYRHNPMSAASLPDNDVIGVFEDGNGKLWVICDTGVACYDRINDTFEPVTVEGLPMRARSFLPTKTGVLFGGAGVIYYYDNTTGMLGMRHIKGGSSKYFTAIHNWTHDNYLLVTKRDGVWVYNIKTSEIRPLEGYEGRHVMASLVDGDGNLWLSDYGNGLCRMKRNGELTKMDVEGLDKNGIVLDLLEKEGKIWVATDGNGLLALDPSTGMTKRIDRSVDAPPSLRSVNRLYRDKYGYLYAGTVRGGLTCLSSTPMKTFRHPDGRESFTVTSIEADDTKVWLGIDGNGLMTYEPDRDDLMTMIKSTAGMKIVSMANLDNDRMLVSTFDNGLFIFDKKSNKIMQPPAWCEVAIADNRNSGVPLDIVKLPKNRVALLTDRIYIGDFDGRNTMTIVPESTTSRLCEFYSDIDNMYCYSDKEIYKVNLSDGKMTKLCRLRGNTLECAAYDGDNYIYIGTPTGVLRFNFDTDTVGPLPGGSIKAMNGDATVSALAIHDGKLWIGSSGRLFMVDNERGGYRCFDVNDGVEPNEFIYKATLAWPRTLLMGGTNGLLKVNIADLAETAADDGHEPLMLTEVEADGHIVDLDGTTANLPEDYTTLRMRLTGGATHPMNTDPVRIFIGRNNLNAPIETTDNTVTIGHLQASRGGRYDIYASMRDAGGNWTRPELVGAIVVPTAWWRRPLMIVIISVLATAVIAISLMWARSKRKQKQNTIKENTKRKSLEKEVGFLMNLNYELRTPLTLIYSRLKMLTEKVKDEDLERDKVIEELDNIYKSTTKMRDIINTTVELWRNSETSKDVVTDSAVVQKWIKENVDATERHETERKEKDTKKEAIQDFDLSHLTLVLVEDDPELQAFLDMNLSTMFNKVLIATNGQDALTLIKNSNPDLIITETRLPKMSGLELCREIKQTKQYSHIPVIMLTTRLEELSIANGNNFGADNYVTKPFDIDLLEKRCISVLKSFDRVRQWYRSQAGDILPQDKRHNNDAEAFILKVREIIEQNVNKPGFGVDDIVDKMLVSRSTLYGKFKEITGQSLGNYINDYKLNRAKEMLLNTTMTMNEISDSLGFNTQRYFSTFFKERTGMTPTAFRMADSEGTNPEISQIERERKAFNPL